MDTEHLRLCKGACGERKGIESFEITIKNADGTAKSRRGVCKTCYQHAKTAKAKEKSAAIDRNTVPKPAACNKCGRGCPDVDFKWREDVAKGGWRNQCNTCFNEKNYSAASRARRRAEDEEGYLKRNAEAHLAWANKNRDKVNAQLRMTKTVPERRWKALLTYVRQKHGEDWEKHVKLEESDELTARFSEECHYCGHKPGGNGDDELNGLDRVDAMGIYSLQNTVPCCGMCNSMKLTYSTDEFIANVRKILINKPEDEILRMSTTQRPRPLGKDKEREEANIKDKTCLLTEDEKMDLWSSQCYLCRRAPALGIDRVNASLGYVPDNCKACCSQCNFMKKDWTLEKFMGHVSRIHLHTHTWVLGDCNNRLSGIEKDRVPIAVLDDARNVIMYFPTESILTTVRGNRIRMKNIRVATPAEYNSQIVTQPIARSIFERLRSM